MSSRRKKTPVWLVARARAAWNKDKGGVLLTGQYTRSDANGNHYRVLVDGGNEYCGRKHWVIATASGGNYSLSDSAMASAVSQVLGIPCGCGDDEIHYCGWDDNWSSLAKEKGWTLYSWEQAGTVVLIPNKEVAAKLLEEYRKYE